MRTALLAMALGACNGRPSETDAADTDPVDTDVADTDVADTDPPPEHPCSAFPTTIDLGAGDVANEWGAAICHASDEDCGLHPLDGLDACPDGSTEDFEFWKAPDGALSFHHSVRWTTLSFSHGSDDLNGWFSGLPEGEDLHWEISGGSATWDLDFRFDGLTMTVSRFEAR